jgi:adenylate cyclase
LHLVARVQKTPDISPRGGAEGSVAQESVLGIDAFGARLALALKASNMSRSQLAAALGVDKSVISRWLSGQVRPSDYNIARLSALFAKTLQGFNMTLWAAPPAEFEAALGLMPAASAFSRTRAERDTATLVSDPPERRVHTRWVYIVGAISLLVAVAGAVWLWSRSTAGPPSQNRPAAVASIAVMPFVNMSGDPAKEYLGDGLSEEILNDLANTSNLRVAARTSSFSFKGKQANIGEIARKLSVRTVLEGSVRQDGNRVRIVAQLIDAQNGFHIWSARYDRKVDDVLAVQDEIARAIVEALSQKLIRRPHVRIIAPEAYQDYLQAQYFFRQRTVAGSARADELLKAAIKRQPDFAGAYAMRGHLLMLMAGDGGQMLAEAQRMIAKALQFEPENQDALDTEIELSLHEWDWAAVYRAGRQLLSQPRRNANSYNGIGFFYQYMGFPNLALEARRRAVQLDPLAFSYRNNLAAAQWHLGQLGEAVATAGLAAELQPNHLAVLRELCALHAAVGNMSQAHHYAELIEGSHNSHFPWVAKDCEIEIAFGEHRKLQARALLDSMDRKRFDSAELALDYARAGDLNQAMKFFSEAYERRELSLIWVRYDAKTPKAVVADPRWQALWRRPLLVEWQRYHDRIAADPATRRFR